VGIFDRMGRAMGRTADKVVGNVETSNIEAVFVAAVQTGTEQLVEHRGRVAALAARQVRLQQKATATEQALKEVMVSLPAILEEGDDDVAVVLIARKDELTHTLERELSELADGEAQVEAAKAGLVDAGQRLEALKREREVAVAQAAVADAAIDIHDASTGLSDNPTHRGLASVRDAIGALDRSAADGYVIDGEGVKGRVEALGRKASEASAREQLEALKRARDDDDRGEDD
jgi:phage shock protein A